MGTTSSETAHENKGDVLSTEDLLDKLAKQAASNSSQQSFEKAFLTSDCRSFFEPQCTVSGILFSTTPLEIIRPVVVYLTRRIIMAELFSVNEAAAIAEVSPETIRTALDKKSVKPSHKRKTGKAVRHQFSVGDVLFVKLLVEFPFPLSREDKKALAQILARGDTRSSHWSREGADLVYRSGKMQLLVECKSFRQTVAKNLATFRWGRRRVVSSPEVLGGEPVFRGTRIPVQHVASLFRKSVPEQEIVEDFPSLSERDLAYARLFSRLGEKPGRPRKRLAIQRRHGAA